MSSIALTNAAGGERVQETLEIVTPIENYVVPNGRHTIDAKPTTIRELCKDLAKESINLRPGYNRFYKWSIKKFRSYIKHIWTYGSMLQSLTLYKLSTDELNELLQENKKYKRECVDGQHRLAALKHFCESTPINDLSSKDNMVYIDVKDLSGNDVALFYRKNNYTVAWSKETRRPVQYMYVNPDADTPDIENQQTNDCNRFNNIVVQLQTITSSLMLSEKKRIFIDLQQGVKVTGDDLYRNLEAPVVVKLADTRKSYIENIIPHVTTKHLQFITHAQIRYHELSRLNLANAEEEADAIFATLRDRDIKPALDNFIKNDYIGCDQILDCDDESFGKYKIDLDRLIKFCESLPVKTKLPPILMIAVYKHFSKMDDATYNSKLPIIVSWMEQTNNEDDEVDFIADVQDKIKETNLKYHDYCKIDKVWEKPTDSDDDEKMKREIYIKASNTLSEYNTERVIAQKVKRDVTPAQKIDAAAKQKWKCNICKDLLTENYQTDHVKPLCKSGSNDDANLQALCPNCHAAKTRTDKSKRKPRKDKSK